MSDERAQQQADDDLREVMSTAGGRRFLWALLEERAGTFRESYSGEQTHRAAYLEGRRSIALEITAECQRVDSPNYVHMLREALKRREHERLENERRKLERDDG